MRVLLLAGEPSGDRLAAAVAVALRAEAPDVELAAMGGDELRAAGVRIVVDSRPLAVVGITEVLSHLPAFLRAKHALAEEIASSRPDVIVPVDFPDFNLRIAALARARGVPVAWLVGPQVWAWRPGRVAHFARAVSRMLVLFPFELETWQRAGVPVETVGHPMAELPEIPRETARASLDVPSAARVLAILPGSRRKEVRHLWPVLAEAGRRLAARHPDLQTLVPLAPGIDASGLADSAPPRTRFVDGRAREVIAACDVAAVASGTATLETALACRPLVACYRVGWITMALSRLAADRDFLARGTFALPNLVLGRRVVPELYQERFTAGALEAELAGLLADDAARRALGEELRGVREALGGGGAAARAARAILDVARRQP